ncbi:CYTH and CHAD domain-containing protein [Pengzhenrongella frigida]|uniref:CYTH and CHAD domain-containing protein n=1 Tax=Pengzhenrongella frigida TaxID=1259133 RepID=A0A4Q5N2W4_9MICO|nr:CYTH and CHAD domain-containing protein [Cellulomonas sp. HLT2-17]RYV52542.1 CYTH and CHAD domain-containing protein [Cellulomonas sp. HLT2-17]
MKTHREIEAKLEVAPDAVLPDLAALAGVATIDAPATFTLEAVYLDTPDLRLARARITLRRRTGGTDAGWHLKLPVSAQERIELGVALGSADDPAADPVPAEIAAAVAARVRTAPIEPVVVLHTRRTVRVLRDRAGRVLAELADDSVTARSPAARDEILDTWREWELELVEGDLDLLAAAVDLLQAADGAMPAHSSKLARALGDRLPDPAEQDRQAVPAAGTAGAALRDHLRAQRDNLLTRDPQVRRDEPDAVHQMRVSTRQLRSALATFRPLLSGDTGEHLRAELGWLGELLGVARDAEVARARLAELVAAEPAELVAGPVGERLDADRADAYRAAHDHALTELDSARYFRLLDTLDDLADAPPLAAAARGPARKVLPARVRREWKRLERAFRAATKAPPGPRRDEHLHETRKAAKRARYAAEAVSPVLGRPAEKFARAAKDLQTLLGDHHDSVELRSVLLRVGSQAQLAGESAFTYGRLHALEQAHAAALEAQLPRAWRRMSARGKRRWLR